MNKYAQFFTDDMTDKQVTFQFFELCDKVEKGSKDESELEEAYSKAWINALERDMKRLEAIARENCEEGMSFVICA